MTISAPVLLESLREYRLLDEEQIDQLVLEVRAHSVDAETLAGELCRRVTGQPLSHQPLIAYLRAKYAPLYGI